MIIRKCINYNICNQLKVKNSTEYCYDCITYFNKKIKIHNEECEDYNCYNFDMNYNRIYNENISYDNYIK